MPEIKILTSFRGIAAFLVLVYHVRALNDWHFSLDNYTEIFSIGYIWVDFFFILSGFIMAYVYGDWFQRAWTSREYFDFLGRRLRRIYPLHLAILLAFIPLTATSAIANREPATSLAEQVWTFLLDVLLVHAWLPSAGSWNGPAWSISAEWAAYLLFPLFLFFVIKRRWWFSCGFVLIGLVSLYAMASFRTDNNLDIWNHFGTLRCFAGFSLGLLVHRTYAAALACPRRWAERILGSDLAGGAVLVLVVVLLNSPVHDIWLLPTFGATILCAALNHGWLRTGFETPLLHGLGLISYSVYMTHWLVVCLAFVVRDHLPAGSLGVLMVATTLSTLLLSLLTYRYIERPFRRWPGPFGALLPRRLAPVTTTRS